jgi:ribonuclease Z
VFEVSSSYLSYKLDIIELNEEESVEIGWREDYHVSAYPLHHRVPCFGYVLKEKPAKGVFVNEKAFQMGLPKGPLVSTLLKQGKVTLDNGKEIRVEDCLSDPIPGRKFVFLGDTWNSDKILEVNNFHFVYDFNEITPSKLLEISIKLKEKFFVVLVYFNHTA